MFLRILISSLILTLALACETDSITDPQELLKSGTQESKFSEYVEMRDGTRIAVTVYLPNDLEANEQVPTLFVLTRYGREDEVDTGAPFTTNGYAIVTADARGTSASFGRRPGEYTPTEVQDAKELVDWAIAQDWCDGNIGAYGVSYTGTTAELLAATQHPAVKAVIPGWSDFDIYNSPARPYGAIASGFIRFWSDFVASIDRGQGAVRVDADHNGQLLQEAIDDHDPDYSVFDAIRDGEFRDSKIGDFSYVESSPLDWKAAIEASNVPMLVFASWLDAASAAGAIHRFRHYSNPQKLILMPDNHGADSHASPYRVSNRGLSPSMSSGSIMQRHIDFFDTHLKGLDKGVEEWPNVMYYNFAEEVYHHAESWPPSPVSHERFYFEEDNELNQSHPTRANGLDAYNVDFSVTTGSNNRWFAQIGYDITGLHDRGSMDAKMLTYTSDPLSSDIQITGTPVISLWLSSSHDDGLILVYLEDVDENGKSTYVTEGGLRMIHRREVDNPYFEQDEPYHSFFESHAAPMPIDEFKCIRFELLPTSVKIKAGHRIRIAIAGADKGTFDRIPTTGSPTWRISRNISAPSFVDIPISVN